MIVMPGAKRCELHRLWYTETCPDCADGERGAERAEMDRRAAECAEREREAWGVYDAARAALDAITEQPARAVLDLHRWTDVEFPRCDGCDMDGYDCEQPTWPCRTTEAIAAHYGIELPDFRLWRRP